MLPLGSNIMELLQTFENYKRFSQLKYLLDWNFGGKISQKSTLHKIIEFFTICKFSYSINFSNALKQEILPICNIEERSFVIQYQGTLCQEIVKKNYQDSHHCKVPPLSMLLIFIRTFIYVTVLYLKYKDIFSSFQCGCGHINCPCCNLLMNLEMTDPSLLQ